MMLLDDRERIRFAQYCKLQVESSQLMAKQFEKLPNPATAELAKREKLKAAGYQIVCDDLSRPVESVGISGRNVGQLDNSVESV